MKQPSTRRLYIVVSALSAAGLVALASVITILYGVFSLYYPAGTAQDATPLTSQLADGVSSGALAVVRSVASPVSVERTTISDPATSSSNSSSPSVVEPAPTNPVSGLSSGSSGSSSSSGASSSVVDGQRYSSTNWSGYVSGSGTFTSIAGSWTVPNPTATSSTTYSADAAWIGIGGVSSSDLIQVGTADTIAPNGSVTISAFYELLPYNASYITSLNVSPGDAMTASIKEISTNVWTITITDTTTGQSYSTNVNYSSSHSTADWIEEAPSTTGGRVMPLANFGSVSFTNASATLNGVATGMSTMGLSSITMTDSRGNIIATPSGVSNNSFSVTYQ